MLWEQMELENLLDLRASCLKRLNFIYHTMRAMSAGDARVTTQLISNRQRLCRISAKVNYCVLLSFFKLFDKIKSLTFGLMSAW